MTVAHLTDGVFPFFALYVKQIRIFSPRRVTKNTNGNYFKNRKKKQQQRGYKVTKPESRNASTVFIVMFRDGRIRGL